MNEREALEHILENINLITYKELEDICTQALAPQEPQQKTLTVEEIKNILKHKINKCTSIGICTLESESNCLTCKKSLLNIVLAEFEKAVE